MVSVSSLWWLVMTGRPVGVVVVGSGHGCRVHVPAARNAGLEVLGVVGRDREKTAKRAARAGVDRVFTSLDEALTLPGVDAVIISTPPHTHAALAEEAIAAGRHLLVEKPFTVDADEARRLHALAQRAGVVALVGHEFRFSADRMTLRHAIAGGAIGTPRLATFVGHNAFAASLDLRMPGWWFDPAQGGGWLGASVSHIIDAIRWWLGDFEVVSADLSMASDRDPDTQAEDSVSARFRMASGCEGVLQQSAAVWGSTLNLFRVTGPLGTADMVDGTVRISNANGQRLLDPVAPAPTVVVEEGSDPRNPFSHIEIPPTTTQAAVWRDLIGGTPIGQTLQPATFADGVACMEVIDAIRLSAADGGRVVALKGHE
jgi:predicted dehydrogenase